MCVICAGGLPVCSMGPLCSIENVHQVIAVGSVMSGWGVVTLNGVLRQQVAKFSGKNKTSSAKIASVSTKTSPTETTATPKGS